MTRGVRGPWTDVSTTIVDEILTTVCEDEPIAAGLDCGPQARCHHPTEWRPIRYYCCRVVYGTWNSSFDLCPWNLLGEQTRWSFW
jgi:hypothetical protein